MQVNMLALHYHLNEKKNCTLLSFVFLLWGGRDKFENSWITIMKYFSIKNVISVKELVHIGGLTITER